MNRQAFIRTLVCMVLASALSLCTVSEAFGQKQKSSKQRTRPTTRTRKPSGERVQTRPSRVRVRVDVISASNTGKGVDREIKGFSKQLKGTLGYESYRLVDRAEKPMTFGGRDKVSLPDRKTLEIHTKGVRENKVEMNLQIKEKGKTVINTDVSLPNKGTVFIGGYPHEKGKLIIAVTPEVEEPAK